LFHIPDIKIRRKLIKASGKSTKTRKLKAAAARIRHKNGRRQIADKHKIISPVHVVLNSKKRLRFLKGFIFRKRITAVPGIGRVNGGRLIAKGYLWAQQLYSEFRKLGAAGFVKWLLNLEIRIDYADRCVSAMEDRKKIYGACG